MDKQAGDKQAPAPRTWGAAFRKNFSAPLAGIALAALSAWMIITGVKGLAGFEVSQHSALADLIGIVIVFLIARWLALRPGAK